MYDKYFIALDFDGTLVEHAYPAIGNIKQSTINLLLAKLEEVNKSGQELVIILWTCRTAETLEAAKNWCKQNLPINIIPKYYNENPEVFMNSPKIFANEYVGEIFVWVKAEDNVGNVAIANENVIGKDNQLIWHLPEDLKRFKEI